MRPKTKRWVLVLRDTQTNKTYLFHSASLDDAISCIRAQRQRTPSEFRWTPAMDRYLWRHYHKLTASHLAQMFRGRGYRSVTKNSVISRYRKLKRLPQWKKMYLLSNSGEDFPGVTLAEPETFTSTDKSTPRI